MIRRSGSLRFNAAVLAALCHLASALMSLLAETAHAAARCHRVEEIAQGIPIRVTRTYDSRRRAEPLDFGYGWSVDYQNVHVQKNLTPGFAWEVYKSGLLTFCVRPIGKRTVSVSLPDGKLERFDVGVTPACDTGQAPSVVDATFTPRADTTSTLTALDNGSLLVEGGTVYDPGT